MNTLNTLAKMLSDKVQNGTLEEITLTNSGSLRTFAKNMIAGQLRGSNIPAVSTEVFKTVGDFHDIISNQRDNGDMLAAFQQIADAFAIRLSDSYKTLSSIKESVNGLVRATTCYAKSRISEDPILASTEAEKVTYTRLKPLRWDLMSDVSEPVLINKLCRQLGIEEVPAGSDEYIQDVLISRLPFENERTKTKFDEVEVTPQKAAKIIDSVYNRVCDKLGHDAVKYAIANIMTLDEYKCRKAVASIKRLATGENANDINHMLKMVYVYNNVLPQMTEDVLDVAASTRYAIEDRCHAMESFIDVTAYLCSYYRNKLWRDSILVPGMKINTDNWDDFKKANKQIIKSNPTLALLQYKNKIYGEDNLPLYGVKSESIINRCDEIAKEAYAEASLNTLKCNQQKKEIFREAFINIAGTWLRNQKQFSVEYMHANEPERYAAAIYDSNPEDAVENMFYTVILNSCYVNTLTSKLHNRLRNEYKKLYLTGTDVNERDIINADTKVLADTVNEFLVDLVLV